MNIVIYVNGKMNYGNFKNRIKNNIIPFGGYKVINLFGLIFTKSDLTDEDKNHENIHSV